MAGYESEHTRFMREYLEKHPEEVESQRKGRAIWWDHPQDPDTQARQKASKVPQAPYVYQTKG